MARFETFSQNKIYEELHLIETLREKCEKSGLIGETGIQWIGIIRYDEEYGINYYEGGYFALAKFDDNNCAIIFGEYSEPNYAVDEWFEGDEEDDWIGEKENVYVFSKEDYDIMASKKLYTINVILKE